jgi:hypothetical protein
VVLRVLLEVAELARGLDPLGHLGAVDGLEALDLGLEIRPVAGRHEDAVVVHQWS